MATITKIVRVRNPRRKRASASRRRRVHLPRNRKGRFVKRSRGRVKSRRVHNTKRKVKRTSRRRANRAVSRVRRRSNSPRIPNPVLLELGAVNPRRRRTKVARRRRRTRNPRRRRHTRAVARVRRRRTYRRRRRNPMMLMAPRRRRHHRRHRRNRRHYSRRRNPALFGRSSGKDLLYMVGGGLVGVAATKYIPTLLPTSVTGMFGGGALMSVIVTGAGAFIAGWLARRFVGEPFGDAVLFGGLMQTGSAALNAFAPASIAGRLALSGVGDIIPGNYVVPQNPLRVLQMPAAATSGVGAFGGAFGRRR